MTKSICLTDKKFWIKNQQNIALPARFNPHNYSRKIIFNKISKYILPSYRTFIEIGACPGMWANFFSKKYFLTCDSLDYTPEAARIIKGNYKLLKISGNVFIGDILKKSRLPKKYDVVLSDGLIEHFTDPEKIFKNHLSYLNKGGLLIIGVPNIKKSWLYNFFAKFDSIGYLGYEHVEGKELIKYATDNNLEILFCDYLGVFNLGLISRLLSRGGFKYIFPIIHFLSQKIMKILKADKESKIFSPYIFLIAKNL